MTHSTDASLPHLRAAQVDLAPTLSLLLGLPVPRTSVGRSLLAPLSLLSPSERVQALDANAEQLHKTFDDVCDDAALRERLHKLFIEAKSAAAPQYHTHSDTQQHNITQHRTQRTHTYGRSLIWVRRSQDWQRG